MSLRFVKNALVGLGVAYCLSVTACMLPVTAAQPKQNEDYSNNEITDITSLSRLTNLTYLGLYDNQITDIAPLSRLTNLTNLGLNNNEITDITPLSRLTNLTRLWLQGNEITDITSLSRLTNLTWLELTDNPLTNYTCPIQREYICSFMAEGLLEELSRRIRRDLLENSTNTPETIDAVLLSRPYSELAVEQREYFFQSETKLKAGALGSLGIPKSPITSYAFYIQSILTKELDFDIEELGKVYGDAELYKAKKAQDVDFYLSLIPFGSSASNTFVVIWEKDPRSIE